jgi:hypothetical protein
LGTARTHRFALPLDAPFPAPAAPAQRRTGARFGASYGSAPTPQATLGLRAAGSEPAAARCLRAAVAFGAEDEAPPAHPDCTHAIALYDLGATPEAENRAASCTRCALPCRGAMVAAVVDATDSRPLRRRCRPGGRAARGVARWGEALGRNAVVVDLESGEVAAAADLEAAFALPGATAAS